VVVDQEDLPKAEYPLVRDEKNASKKRKPALHWNRWLALERQLHKYEVVFSADPDQFPSRHCFLGTSLRSALNIMGLPKWGSRKPPAADDGSANTAAGGSSSSTSTYAESQQGTWRGPDVILRDVARFQDTNSAGVFFQDTPGAHLLFKLLFEKMWWEGLPRWDQGGFDHSILELLELWARATRLETSKPLRSTECLTYFYQVPTEVAWLALYEDCWQNLVEAIFGPFEVPGGRGRAGLALRSPVYLANPSEVDINFVCGHRNETDEPLIWHLAGPNKKLPLHETGRATVMDWELSRLWGIKEGVEMPERKRPGAWMWSWAIARNRTRSRPRLRLSGTASPQCEAWTKASKGFEHPCHPGSFVEDCREGWMAFC